MSETLLRVGCRVHVPKKNVKGTVQYIGTTAFSTGKWIGINLDEPKGKNNGTVDNKEYFKCEENYGMFVRQSQIIILGEDDIPILDLTEEVSGKAMRTSTTRLSSTYLAHAASSRRKSPPVSALPSVKKPEKSSSRLSLVSMTSSTDKEDLSGSTASLSNPAKRTSSFVEKTSKIATKQTSSTVKGMSKLPSARKSVSRESISKSKSPSKDDINNSQTGFVETLKPQFTPGQVLLSPSPAITGSNMGINMIGGNSNVSLLQQEVENLREQLKDLQERYDTMLVKRRQDKERLKEMEQLRINVDQLNEFKARMLESKSALQRELQQARKEAQDAIEARNAHAEEMADLSDTVEMATLDKEMAEEKVEILQQEYQEVKDKLEEVTLDYETLKAELELSASGGEPRERVSYEFKQLEQQNARLQETLLKMRDVVAQGKHDYQRLVKDVDQKKSEIAELSRTKEKLSSRVEQLEEQIVDLQEQVDAAVGAETMASTLTYDKMMLQEEVERLREDISDLEAIESANDQLLEEHKEMELELNERLDMTFAKLREAQREKDAAIENLADREQTIHKYREAMATLQNERQELLTRLEAATNKPVALPESLDYNKVFSETIAHKRAIDLELRQIELKQKEQHVQFLTAFMPDSFMGRGGDHDAILMLLLLPRLLWKCDILLSHIRDKFPAVEKIHRTSVIKEDGVVRFSCGSRLAFHLHYIQLVLHQYLHGLDTCNAETLLSAGARYPDLLAQERVIDSYIVSVKEDRLDENVLTEPLEKCGQVLEALRVSVLTAEPTHASNYLRDACAALIAGCEAVSTDALAIQSLVDLKDGSNEIVVLTQHCAASLTECAQQLRNIRRRVPGNEATLNIECNLISSFFDCVSNIGRILKTFAEVQKQARQLILLEGESDISMPLEKLDEYFSSAADRFLDADETNVGAVRAIIGSLGSSVAKMNNFIETCEYDLVGVAAKPVERPIVLRASSVKKEMEQIKVLAKKLEDREIDIKELKLSLKLKADELSEMVIRKDLIEKKLSNIHKDHEETSTKLKSDLEAARKELQEKSKEFEVTMDHLQVDIDSLEAEKKELKEKLRTSGKKAIADTQNKMDSVTDKATSPTGVAYDLESGQPGETKRLRSLLQQERIARFELECKIASKQILEHTSIPGLKVETEELIVEEKKVEDLLREGAKLRKEVIKSMLPKCIDLSNAKPGEACDISQYMLSHTKKMKEMKEKVNEFKCEASRLISVNRRGGSIRTALDVFPTPQMKAALDETRPVTVGTITIPVPQDSPDAGRTIPLLVNPATLSTLLRTACFT